VYSKKIKGCVAPQIKLINGLYLVKLKVFDEEDRELDD